MKHRLPFSAAASAFVMIAGGSACAQDAALPQDRSEGTLLIGPALVLTTNPYIGGEDDAEAAAIPFFYYENSWIEAGFNGVRVTLAETEAITLKALVEPRYVFIKPEDSPALRGLDRSITVDIGASFGVRTGAYAFELIVRQEVTGEHDGYEIEASLERRVQLAEADLTFSAGASWQSSALMSYQYGVSPIEALSSRPTYDVGAAATPFASVQYSRPLTARWSAFASGSAHFLPEAATDSPILGSSTVISTVIGVAYAF